MSENKKIIPKRRFKEFENADAWEQRELDKLADFSKGSGYSKSDLVSTGEPVILYGRLYTNYETVIRDIDTFVNDISNSVLSKGGEVIVPSSGETAEDISRASVVDSAGIALGGDLNIIYPKAQIDSTFLALTISNGNQKKELSKRSQGKSVVHIRNEDLKKVLLVFPKKEEQKLIGRFFCSLDQTIAFQQRKLEKMKSMKSAYLSEMFPAEGERKPKRRFPGFTDDWEQRELGEIVNWSKGDKLSKEKLNESGNGEPVIHYANLYKFSPVIYDVINWSTSNEGRLIPDNSLLFPMSDVTPVGLARTSTITKSGVKAGGDTLIGTVDDFYSAQFVSYFINANSNKILPLVTGTTVRHISANSLSKLEILLPDIKEQQKISDFLNSIQETIAFQQQKLEKLQNIKKAYLNEMFI